MGAPELSLDPSIRTWVLLPILIVMVLVGLIRHYATILVTPDPPVATEKEQREANYLYYAGALRGNSFNLGEHAFKARVQNLIGGLRRGEYLADPDAVPQTGMPSITDPKSMEAMLATLRTQILTYVPQTLMMSWISSFFGGFVVMKLPFPLTTRFKEMLQAGIGTPDLDVRWVSSISWYIFLLMGLNSVYSLILGGNNQATSQQQPAATFMPMAPNVDKRKVMDSEADRLEIARHRSVLSGVVGRLIAG